MVMKTVAAGTFKAQCLALMDEVESTREPIVITKRGKPVAKLIPIETQKDDIFGFWVGKGRLTELGNIIEPAVPPEDWENDPA